MAHKIGDIQHRDVDYAGATPLKIGVPGLVASAGVPSIGAIQPVHVATWIDRWRECPAAARLAPDSPLEGDGFELPVPPAGPQIGSVVLNGLICRALVAPSSSP